MMGWLARRRERRTSAVLAVFERHPDMRRFANDVAREAGLPGGSIYPELAWLEHQGRIVSGWTEGEHRRRWYQLGPPP